MLEKCAASSFIQWWYSVIDFLIVTASISKLLHSWLFIDLSEHHYTALTSKFNFFLNRSSTMLNNVFKALRGAHKFTQLYTFHLQLQYTFLDLGRKGLTLSCNIPPLADRQFHWVAERKWQPGISSLKHSIVLIILTHYPHFSLTVNAKCNIYILLFGTELLWLSGCDHGLSIVTSPVWICWQRQ